MKKWEKLSSELVFNHKWFKVQRDTVKLPMGRIVDDYFMWPQGDVVLVVPLTKDNEIVLVQQYKHAAAEIVIEVPAGMLNKDEKPKLGARRELEEETGYTSEEFIYIGAVTNSPSKVIGIIHIYLAKNVKKTKDTHFDENENIEVLIKPFSEVMNMIFKREIWVTGSITALLLSLKKSELIKI